MSSWADLLLARDELYTWAKDLETLRPYLDNTDREVVGAAWSLARKNFTRACRNYVKALTEKEKEP